MPISLALPGVDTRTIGEQMQSGLTPFLDQMNDIMRRRNDQLSRIGTGIMTLVTATLGTLGGLQSGIQMVQVTNIAFLELMAAGSFAFIVLIFLKLFELGFLHAVTNQRLNVVITHLANIETSLGAFHAATVSLLQQILDVLKTGITVKGTLQVQGGILLFGNPTITIDSKGPDWLGNLSLLKLLGLVGLLGLTLLLLVLFVAGLGFALKTFTATAVLALGAIALFVKSMIPLVELLGKMSFADIGTLTLGLTALAGFVYGLGKGLALLNPELLKALPNLSAFIKSLGELAALLGKMPLADVGGMSLALTALAAFVYGLAKGLALLNPEILKALPSLSEFIKGLGDLGVMLGKMPMADVGAMAVGLAALAAFVYGLAKGLELLNPDLLSALPGLSEFIKGLGELGQALGKMPMADIGGMAVGLAALAGFVYGLALALKQLSPDLVALLPDFAKFIDSLGQLGKDLAALSMADIGGMALGLAALAGFVYILSLALSQLTADMVANLPGFAEFIAALGDLGVKMSQIAGIDLVGMAFGLAALAGFVYLLALALNTLTDTAVSGITPMTDLGRGDQRRGARPRSAGVGPGPRREHHELCHRGGRPPGGRALDVLALRRLRIARDRDLVVPGGRRGGADRPGLPARG